MRASCTTTRYCAYSLSNKVEYFDDEDMTGSPQGRFVTTLRSCDENQETFYLIRSYDHEKRSDPSTSAAPTRQATTITNRTDTGRTDISRLGEGGNGARRGKRERDTVNYGKAQQFHIWEVARAATAARFYFEPLKIYMPGSQDCIHFEDGGFSHANNPTTEGTNELEDLYGPNTVGIIVSVGTARKDDSKNEKKSLFMTIPRETKKFAAIATDPEGAHKHMKRHSKRSNLSYYRLNDPGRLDVELDEWEPKRTMFNKTSGSTTLKNIGAAFALWASDTDVGDQLRDCAAALVKCRRSRLKDEDKWERFATGARFTCRARGRCDAADFLSRKSFREHLLLEHEGWANDQSEQEKCKRTWRYKRAP